MVNQDQPTTNQPTTSQHCLLQYAPLTSQWCT